MSGTGARAHFRGSRRAVGRWRLRSRFRRNRTSRLTLRQAYLVVVLTFLATMVVSGLYAGVLGMDQPASIPSRCVTESFPTNLTHRDYLTLSIFVNPATHSEFYVPSNVTVPAHTLILITIEDYDNGSSSVSPPYSSVCGTVNGTMSLNGVTLTQLDPGNVAHTFSLTNGTYAGFNVPIPPAGSNGASPSVVTFSVYFNTPGVYRWQCHADCGQDQMTLDGKMSGLLTVL